MPKQSSRLSEAASAHLPVDTRQRNIPLLDDLHAAATALSSDLAAALAERVEELSTSDHEFRTGLHRAFLRILTIAKRQANNKPILFDDAIPGFTALLYKKESFATHWKAQGKEPALDDPRKSPEMAASAVFIEAFVARTRNRVLVIESPDAVFVFFPASDIKRNLKEMGFYHTD
jgi:hypothetical protein